MRSLLTDALLLWLDGWAARSAGRRPGLGRVGRQHPGQTAGLEPTGRPAGRAQPARAHGRAGAAAGGRGLRAVGLCLGADGCRDPHRQVHPRPLHHPDRLPARPRQPGPPHRPHPPDRPRVGPGRRRAGRHLGAGGGRLAAAARPADHPDPGHPHPRTARGRARLPRGRSRGRAPGPPGPGEPDRARVPLRPPRRAAGPAGLR